MRLVAAVLVSFGALSAQAGVSSGAGGISYTAKEQDSRAVDSFFAADTPSSPKRGLSERSKRAFKLALDNDEFKSAAESFLVEVADKALPPGGDLEKKQRQIAKDFYSAIKVSTHLQTVFQDPNATLTDYYVAFMKVVDAFLTRALDKKTPGFALIFKGVQAGTAFATAMVYHTFFEQY